MKDVLNVFFAISESYIQHFTVALTSLLENNKDIDLNIYVIHDAEDLARFDNAVKFIKRRYDKDVFFINIGTIDFSKFNLTSDYPKYTYFRLFLADIVPAGIDKVLFLDSDLIVEGTIKELAETNMDSRYIAAVSEASVDDNVKRLNGMGIPVKSYFNAGVILINIKKWREEKLSEKFLNIAKQHTKDLTWVDQDILNIYFANNWLELDKKFNAVHLIAKHKQTPVIVHYASTSKPWYYTDTHPYNYLYQRYLKLTPFNKYKATGFSFKNFIIKNGKLFKRRLREAGLLKYHHTRY